MDGIPGSGGEGSRGGVGRESRGTARPAEGIRGERRWMVKHIYFFCALSAWFSYKLEQDGCFNITLLHLESN